MDRRELLQTGTALLFTTLAAPSDAAQTAQTAGAASTALGQHPLGAAFAGWQATMLEVMYPPGAASAAHQHPGPTFGFVVSGSIRWAIDGGTPQVLGPGASFFEPMGSVHSTAANASTTEPARLFVVILGKPGEPMSKPAPKPGA